MSDDIGQFDSNGSSHYAHSEEERIASESTEEEERSWT